MKISKFQIIMLAIFVIFLVAGVIAFASYKGSSSSSSLPSITIWGTFPKSAFDQYVSQINLTLPQQMSIQYMQESPSAFHNDFIAALARGQGPDAILIPADLLLPEEDKLTVIPYSALPERTFLDTYIQEVSIYLTQNGILGIPFAVDPLVMYWNRDMFNAAGIAKPPVYWDEFTALNKAITVKSQNGTVTRSAVAMGDFANVVNARELLGTLLLQTGNPVTSVSANGSVVSALSTSAAVDPTKAVDFFTQAVDPTNAEYSWNRSWPDSKSAFLSGTLATYFGFASEISDIRSKNPNLNFDVAPLPQLRSGGQAADYARLYGFSIVRSSAKANTVFQVVSTLVMPQYLVSFSSPTSLYLPSVDLGIIQSGSTDPYIAVFGRTALIARTWLDVDPSISTNILGSMIQAVTSGQKSVSQAVNDAGAQHNAALQNAMQ
jgi:multiple sugar transport system substrate-binding protein